MKLSCALNREMKKMIKVLVKRGSPMWKLIGCFLLLVFGTVQLTAQLFPGLQGEELVNAIRDSYTPSQLLTETQVKDTLYAKVFIQGDSVHCIYSDLAHDLPPGVDPSQWIYEDGIVTNSMNLEHSWPQSKGAADGTPGNRNMHHLFPSRSAINSDRGDFPYGEIPDASTQKWYHLGVQMAAKPSSNIDVYSEFKAGIFEPRESVKGDIARALFYFWTIYRDDAIAADPLFFDKMKADLCIWHEEDPVDDFEELRTARIAGYQEGKANPFILDCSLVKRAYCPNLQECEIVATEPVSLRAEMILVDASAGLIVIAGEEGKEWTIQLTDITGKKIFEKKVESNQKVNVPSVQPGIYIIVAYNNQHRLFGKQVWLFP